MHNRIIRVPLNLGANRPGTELGPVVLETTLQTYLARKGHRDLRESLLPAFDVPVPPPTPEHGRGEFVRRQYQPEVLSVCRQLTATVEQVLATGDRPLVLGGDHSVIMGSFPPVSRHFSDAGLLSFDAHGDVNTPDTTPSGHLHGMPMAVLLGHGDPALVSLNGSHPSLDPGRFVLVGVRDLDSGERQFLADHAAIGVYGMPSIDANGMQSVMADAIQRLYDHGVRHLYVTFDVDALDPSVAPGTSTPVWGGLTYREAEMAIRMLRDGPFTIAAADVVELSPAYDLSNQTGEVMARLLATLLGPPRSGGER